MKAILVATMRLALAFSLAAAVGCAYELVRNGAIDNAKADRVEQGIQKVRELRFKRHVPMILESQSEAERDLMADLQRDFSDEQLRIDGQAGALLGLYPPGVDLKQATVELLKSQIAGFYDPHRKQMVLVEGAADLGILNAAAEFVMQRDLVGEMLLAHELTHALQDQNFGLEAALDKVKNDDDRSLALKSVAEGDATLAGFGYVTGKMDQTTIERVVSRLSDLPQAFAAQTAGAPEALSAPLIFQYSAGARFVAEAYRHGGWKAVSDLYKAPPQSSQQIMNPSLYFDHPAYPSAIRLAGYQNVLHGWDKVDDNTYGELLLQVILKRGLGDQAPQVRLADHWGGDRAIVLRKGNALTVLWYVMFSDELSAQRFGAVYTEMLDKLLARQTAHRVDYRGSAVLIVVGEGANLFAALAPSIWSATTVTRPAPWSPPPIRAERAPSTGRPLGAVSRN